jgi:hypothetical protein
LHSSAQIKFLHQGTHSALQKHNKKFHTKSSQEQQPIFGHIKNYTNKTHLNKNNPYSATSTQEIKFGLHPIRPSSQRTTKIKLSADKIIFHPVGPPPKTHQNFFLSINTHSSLNRPAGQFTYKNFSTKKYHQSLSPIGHLSNLQNNFSQQDLMTNHSAILPTDSPNSKPPKISSKSQYPFGA